MFTPLMNPDLSYGLFKLRERELLHEADIRRLAIRQRAAGPRPQYPLIVKAGNLVESIGTRFRKGSDSPVPEGGYTSNLGARGF